MNSIKNRGIVYNLLIVSVFLLIILFLMLITFNFIESKSNYNEYNLARVGNIKITGMSFFTGKVIERFPKDSGLYIFPNEEVNFSIKSNHDRVDWYINEKLVKEDSDIIFLKNLDSGDYIIKAEVTTNGEISETEWEITVGEVERVKEFIFNPGDVIFTVIIIVLILIMVLILILLLTHIKSSNKGRGDAYGWF